MIGPRAIGWILAILTTVLVVSNQGEVGLARDEIVYMQHGGKYADWWVRVASLRQAPSKDNITRTFGGPGATDNNREHPPLVKTLAGLSHRVLHGGLGVGEVTAYRMPSAILHGVLVLLVYAMVLALWGTAEAVLAALFVVFLPRALFHASLACFDAPIMTLWFATVYAYWRALDGRRWPWQVGVVFGLALATKHNALILPGALGLHYLVLGVREARATGRWRAVITHRWRVIVSLALLGPAVLVALWPWLWLDPIGHVRQWIDFHLTHVHYNFEYLGANWNAPRFPWHVALVTTLFTVPVVTLASALAGAGAWIVRRADVGERARLPGLLLALSAAAAIGPFLLGTTPIFGAEKHWMPALPSICIAAGVGLAWAGRELARVLAPRREARAVAGVIAGVAAVVIAAAAVETAAAQPYALSWYNALAGGHAGGADRGMNRQFWGVAARGVLPVLAEEAGARPRPRPVYSHDASPAWGTYARLGLLPPAFPDAGHEEAGIARSDFALVIHERHFNRHDYLIWKSYRTVRPWFVLRARGVPIVTIYQRPW